MVVLAGAFTKCQNGHLAPASTWSAATFLTFLRLTWSSRKTARAVHGTQVLEEPVCRALRSMETRMRKLRLLQGAWNYWGVRGLQ